LDPRSDRRFTSNALAAVSRVNAREAALEVAEGGLRVVRGADGVTPTDLPAFEIGLRIASIHAAQGGLLADMDRVADALYGRGTVERVVPQDPPSSFTRVHEDG
jgi:hypothetical protein